MFGRKAIGEQSFWDCDVKVVEITTMVWEDEAQSKPVKSRGDDEDRFHAGNGAELHCPKTEDDRVNVSSQFSNHPDKITALNSLAELAGGLVCRDCRYSSMTPVEVSIERKNLADAEADRLHSYTLLEQARHELGQAAPQIDS